jgi:hypothetical protein
VLLIDEIDRADAEFEAFLLEVLSDFQVTVPELGTLAAIHRPLVLLTSNNTRELSEALKRRCLYLFIGYPSLEQEQAVVRLKVPELSPKLAAQAVQLVQQLRNMDLRKSPSISETLDWAKSLVALNANLDAETLDNTMSVLLKHETDLQKVKRRIQVSSGRVSLDDDDLSQFRWSEEIGIGDWGSGIGHWGCAADLAQSPIPDPRRVDMEDRMIKFIAALRAEGVRVSLAESADAFLAVDDLGVLDRETFRLSLRATLVKEAADLPAFDELFPLFFDSRCAAHVRYHRGHDAGRGADDGPGHADVQ